ncbi:hypothetical protein WJ90_15170 [Burkholderia ubonensis]|nr:hypothetical protein WJ90_15170 [Burkholderia ubonensis]
MAKITFTGNIVANGKFGVSVPDSENLTVDAANNVFTNTGTAIEVRDAASDFLADVLGQLPNDISVDELKKALIEIGNAGATAEEKRAAVESSPIWGAIKDKGPEAVAFLMKAAFEYAKLWSGN